MAEGFGEGVGCTVSKADVVGIYRRVGSGGRGGSGRCVDVGVFFGDPTPNFDSGGEISKVSAVMEGMACRGVGVGWEKGGGVEG